jgi:putative intracellular protease/amidase
LSANINTTKSRPKRILIVIANPSTSTTLGGPVGFWASELTHAFYEFVEHGYEVAIASPKGGKCELDAFSDPRDPSGYSAHDLISMGFIHTPKLWSQVENTPSLNDMKANDFDAIYVAGGQSPMFTFRSEARLHRLLQEFYESEKPTVVVCHGTAALLDVILSDGTPLIRGKTMTGFANSEEDFADDYVSKLLGKAVRVMPFRIEDEAKKLGANFITGGLFKPFAVRDDRLITGQQQYSGAAAARLIVEALGV